MIQPFQTSNQQHGPYTVSKHTRQDGKETTKDLCDAVQWSAGQPSDEIDGVGWCWLVSYNDQECDNSAQPRSRPIQSEGPVTNTLDSQPAGIYFQ